MSSMKLNIDTIKLQIMFEYLFSLFYFGRNPFFEIYFLSLNLKKWVSSKKNMNGILWEQGLDPKSTHAFRFIVTSEDLKLT